MIRIAICDDDPIFLEYECSHIKNYMKSYDVDASIETFLKGDELLLRLGLTDPFDLIMLDIQMKNMNGLELARSIRLVDKKIPIVFVTAFIDYTIDAFKVRAFRYICKDEDKFADQIAECIDSYMEMINAEGQWIEKEFLIGRRRLYIKDILYVESKGNYTEFVLLSDSSEILRIRNSLKEITRELLPLDFIRLNSGQTVNMFHITDIGRYEAMLDNGRKVRISQRRYMEVRSSFVLYEGRRM